jgi:HlyD family secretion protein
MLTLKNTFQTLLLLLLVLAITGCGKKEKTASTQTHIVEAKIQESNTQLYYSGVIQPLRIVNVISPIDGTIQAIHFHYGSMVQKGQLLMDLNSVKSKQDYITALTTYIKDKDQFLRSKNSFEATTALYKAGIVDKETYLNEKSQLNTNQIAYVNSLESLKQISPKIAGAQQNIETLTLENISALEKIIKQQLGRIKIYAPITGIAMLPQKSGNEPTAGPEKLATEHSEVKQDQIILGLGDMHGISTTINISESDINNIKINQDAVISVAAIPGLLMQAKVSTVPLQAKSAEGSSGSLANFTVHVIVPSITDLQRSLLRIGMTAKINITIHNPAQIKIPIQAVFKKNDHNMVSIMNRKTGKPEDIPVETGETDLNQVVILKGLNSGDKVLVRD